jgi:hypothetical protein
LILVAKATVKIGQSHSASRRVATTSIRSVRMAIRTVTVGRTQERFTSATVPRFCS